MISIKNVVSVDFDIVKNSDILGDFETTVYIAPISLVDASNIATNIVLLTNAQQVTEQMSGNSAVIQSALNYFANGGEKLIVINPTTYDLDSFVNAIESAKNLARDFMYVCISEQLVTEQAYTDTVLTQIVDYCDNSIAPDKIRLLLTTNSMTFIEDKDLTESFAIVKYSTKMYDSNPIDVALLIGAYFSKINLNDANTIRDYCYTEEKLLDQDIAEGVTQAEFETLVKNENGQGYYNFDDMIGNNVVNFGGNLASIEGIAIHTDFGANAVERDISYSVLEKMIGKQYLTEQGISNIKAAINSNLQRYKNNGYLNLGAAYSGETLEISYNNKKYLVIESGTTLPQGFYIYSVPMQDISVADRQAKKFTPLYVVMETQSGARVVEIKGEIRA